MLRDSSSLDHSETVDRLTIKEALIARRTRIKELGKQQAIVAKILNAFGQDFQTFTDPKKTGRTHEEISKRIFLESYETIKQSFHAETELDKETIAKLDEICNQAIEDYHELMKGAREGEAETQRAIAAVVIGSVLGTAGIVVGSIASLGVGGVIAAGVIGGVSVTVGGSGIVDPIRDKLNARAKTSKNLKAFLDGGFKSGAGQTVIHDIQREMDEENRAFEFDLETNLSSYSENPLSSIPREELGKGGKYHQSKDYIESLTQRRDHLFDKDRDIVADAHNINQARRELQKSLEIEPEETDSTRQKKLMQKKEKYKEEVHPSTSNWGRFKNRVKHPIDAKPIQKAKTRKSLSKVDPTYDPDIMELNRRIKSGEADIRPRRGSSGAMTLKYNQTKEKNNLRQLRRSWSSDSLGSSSDDSPRKKKPGEKS